VKTALKVAALFYLGVSLAGLWCYGFNVGYRRGMMMHCPQTESTGTIELSAPVGGTSGIDLTPPGGDGVRAERTDAGWVLVPQGGSMLSLTAHVASNIGSSSHNGGPGGDLILTAMPGQ
jgi:hypothetical protein